MFPGVTGNSVGKQKNTVRITAHAMQMTLATYPIVSGTLKTRFEGRYCVERCRTSRMTAGMA